MELLELFKIVGNEQNQANVQQQIDALRTDIARAALNVLYTWYETQQLDKRLKKLEAKSLERPIS